MNVKKGVKRLALTRETVRELSQPELQQAAGGAASVVCIATHVPTQCTCTGYYPSLNAPCTTGVV